MPLDPRVLLEWPFAPVEQRLREDDAILYALSVGVGADPMDERQLAFVTQRGAGVGVAPTLPTLATVLAPPGPWTSDPRTGVTRAKLVHGEQSVRILRPLPREGMITSLARVRAVADRGAERGAVIYVERELRLQGSQEVIAHLRSASVCRADGGFGGSPESPYPLHALPGRECDERVELKTTLNAALLYQLNGDRNPLHTSPAFARKAGFDRPILHGLCSFGIAGQLLLGALGDYRADAIGEIGGRFSAPAFPGDTLQVRIWREGATASFQVWAVERNAKVIDNGFVRLGITGTEE